MPVVEGEMLEEHGEGCDVVVVVFLSCFCRSSRVRVVLLEKKEDESDLIGGLPLPPRSLSNSHNNKYRSRTHAAQERVI